MKYTNSINYLLVFFVAVVSSYKNKSTPDFYRGAKQSDVYRIPLIEPIEIISADKFNWSMKLTYYNIGLVDNAGGIKKIRNQPWSYRS
ncbi:MAG: hypothetical protein JST86_19185 [Bacteroidetes bacterium]|nr:hypothetical protein [Bacteroidota bacterium]